MKVAKKCAAKRKRAKKSCCKNKTLLRTAKSLCNCKQCTEKSGDEAESSAIEHTVTDNDDYKTDNEKLEMSDVQKSNSKIAPETLKRPERKISMRFNCGQLKKSGSVLKKTPATSAKVAQPRLEKAQVSNSAKPLRHRTGKKSKSLLKYVLKQQNVRELASHDKCSCCQKCISKLMRFIKVEIARQGCMWRKRSPSPNLRPARSCLSYKSNKYKIRSDPSKLETARSSGSGRRLQHRTRTKNHSKRKSLRPQGVKARENRKKRPRAKKLRGNKQLKDTHLRSRTKRRYRKTPKKQKTSTDDEMSIPSTSTGVEMKEEDPTKPASSMEKSNQDEPTVPEVSAGVPENSSNATIYELKIPDYSYLPKRNGRTPQIGFYMHLPDGENHLKTWLKTALSQELEKKNKPMPAPGNHGDQFWILENNQQKSLRKEACKLSDIRMSKKTEKLDCTSMQKYKSLPMGEVIQINIKNDSKCKYMLIPAISAGTGVPIGLNNNNNNFSFQSPKKPYRKNSVSKNPYLNNKRNQPNSKEKAIRQMLPSQTQTTSDESKVGNSLREEKNLKTKNTNKQEKFKPKIIKIARKTRNSKPNYATTKHRNQNTKTTRVKYIRKNTKKSKARKRVKAEAIKPSNKVKVGPSQKNRKNKKNIGNKWKLLTNTVIKKLKSAIQKRLVKNNDVNKKVLKRKAKPQLAPMPRAGTPPIEDCSWMGVSDVDSNILMSELSDLELDEILCKKNERKKAKAPCPSARIPTLIAMIKTALRDLTPFGATGKRAIAK